MDLNKLAYQKQAIDQLNQAPVLPKRRNFGKQSFDETHKRITTYLHIDIYAAMNNLREQGELPNITGFINTAVAEYLQRHYHK
jgi:hypothetical protein